MGLPLFVAPIESDIPSKPATKSPSDPVHSRSPIRRNDRRRQLNETREHRLRLLAALQGNESNLNLPQSRPAERRTATEALGRLDSSGWAAEDASLEATLERLTASRRENNNESRDSPRLNAEADVSDFMPLQEESYLRNDGRYVSWHDGHSFDAWGPSHSQPLARSSRDLSHPPSFVPSPSAPSGRYRIPRRDSAEPVVTARPSRYRLPDAGEYVNEYRRRRGSQMPPGHPRRMHRPGRSVRYVDGLGDRDRSLSPEGDGVWDILQSTLTEDPQPPSIGSSFASTNASAATSQTTLSSANTSIINPVEDIEPPCDPVVDYPDSEGNRDEEAEEHDAEYSRRPTPHERRSYADVAAEVLPAAHDDRPERLEWLSGMQRIVRNLASQQDIPDEWWAAAGLSRSAAWDESN